MTRKIKHVSELPKWFQIKKYNLAKNFGVRQWFEQLCVRNIVFAVISRRISLLKKENKDIFDDEFLERTDNFFEALAIINDDPIVNVITNEKLLKYSYFYSIKEMLQEKLHLAFGVRPITIRELIEIKKVINPELLDVIKIYDDGNFAFLEDIEDLDQTIDKMATKYSSESHSTVRINWCLPDNLLIDHFKNYLESYRPKGMRDKKRYRHPDFNNWYRLGILPYIDLKIWELKENVSIPYRVIADAIFLNGENGEETIRKTTAIISEGILKGDMLEMLGSCASLDQDVSEKNINYKESSS